MSRQTTRSILFAAAVAALSTALTGAAEIPFQPASEGSRQPNVLVILVDDLPWPDVSTYGLTRVATPNIDRIAKSGVAFTNGYVAASVCSVSRAALLTGKSPQGFGFDYNLDDSTNMKDGLPVSQLTMADRLKALGYHTGLVGKWHQGETKAYYPTNRGFDEFYGFLAGETVYVDPKTPGMVSTHTAADRPFNVRKPTSEIIEGPDATPVHNFDKYLTSELTNRAVSYIDKNSGGEKPFFLYLAYNAPHWPLQVPQPYYDRFANIKDPARRTYVAMIAALDDGVGRVLDELDRTGQRENTIVLFLSDNGCPMQFGFCDCSHPLGAGKFTYVEGGTRVPFLMSWPSHLKPHAPIDLPVSSLDIMPTVLKAAAPQAPLPALEGRDLMTTINHAPPNASQRLLIWGQDPVFAARSGKWKLWTSRDEHKTALYDLDADPWELHDVSADHPQETRELSEAIDKWRIALPKAEWPIHFSGPTKICGRVTERIY